jgi:hypothetical protein
MNASLLVAAPLMIAAIVMAVRFVGCGIDSDPIDGYGGSNGDENGNGDDQKPVAVTANFTGKGALSAQAGFPTGLSEDPHPYSTPGTFTYPIPYWCTSIDLVLLGAGGGGGYGGTNDVGGSGGAWKTATLQRGPDIPLAATTISVTVSQGGAGGTLSAPQGSPGGDTTATWGTSSGPTTSTASGGDARGSSSGPSGDSPSPSSESIGDASLNGGVAQSTAGADGNPPGGGGAGGAGLKPGGAGADGAAVLVARQS